VNNYILAWVMIPPICILDMGAHRVGCVCAEAVTRGFPLDQGMCCKQNLPQSVIDDPLSEMHEIASQESTLMRFHFLYKQDDSDPIFAWWPRRLDVGYSALKYLHPQIYAVVISRYVATLRPYS